MLHNFLIADPKIRVDLNCEIIVETNFMVYIEIKVTTCILIQYTSNNII